MYQIYFTGQARFTSPKSLETQLSSKTEAAGFVPPFTDLLLSFWTRISFSSNFFKLQNVLKLIPPNIESWLEKTKFVAQLMSRSYLQWISVARHHEIQNKELLHKPGVLSIYCWLGNLLWVFFIVFFCVFIIKNWCIVYLYS